jgi:beta-glucosidase
VGDRPGSDVVMAFVRDVESPLRRPEKELKAFAKMHLQPSETRTVSLTLDADAFSYYDPGQDGWVMDAGEFEVLVGRSALDLHLRGRFKLGD